MLTIRGAFHLTHMVKDLAAATRIYRDVFQAPVHHDGYSARENRDASFAAVSDAYIELFAPRDADAPEPTSTAGRFIRRSGEGLANFGWFIEEEVPEAIRFCEAQGYRLVGAGLGSSAGPPPSYFFVHPRQAHGIMLEIAGSAAREQYIPDDPRARPGWAASWRDDHPLGIERLNAVSFAVRDFDGAIGFLRSLTDAPILQRGTDDETGKESAYLWCGDHAIEVMQGISEESEIAHFVRDQGPRIHSATFKVKDLGRAAAYLREKGVGVLDGPGADSFTLDPGDLLGARYVLTERAIPNDPRGASG